jgi:hypothetical protein
MAFLLYSMFSQTLYGLSCYVRILGYILLGILGYYVVSALRVPVVCIRYRINASESVTRTLAFLVLISSSRNLVLFLPSLGRGLDHHIQVAEYHSTVTTCNSRRLCNAITIYGYQCPKWGAIKPKLLELCRAEAFSSTTPFPISLSFSLCHQSGAVR